MNPAKGRLLVKVDKDYKNHFQLTDDIQIEIARSEENFDLKYVNSINGIVLNGEYEGYEVLVNHNSPHPTNLVCDHDIELAKGVSLYSIPIAEIYVYRENNESEWKPFGQILIVERIWKPYLGIIEGIDPTEIKNKLFVVKGNFLNQVISTGLYCDYTIYYQESNGRMNTITRMKDDSHLPEGGEEVLAIDYDMTEQVLNGDLLIGEDVIKAKKFKV